MLQLYTPKCGGALAMGMVAPWIVGIPCLWAVRKGEGCCSERQSSEPIRE